MNSNQIFVQFCNERNIKKSTMKGYVSALQLYESFHNKSIDFLIDEAICEENMGISLKDRKIKNRLLDFRSYLINNDFSSSTQKTYFSKIKTFYYHFEIDLPKLPSVKLNENYKVSYLDLPDKKHIAQAIELSAIDMKSIILFMSSSGTAKAETLSLTVNQFVEATIEYHNGGSVNEILKQLELKRDIVPTFYIKRLKTGKYYYTFCSPEASTAIVKYLKSRKNLKKSDKLFDISGSTLISKFQDINDKLDWGFKGNYRFFRTHSLRKFHASNLGLNSQYIDELQGRGKSQVHEAYIKTNPQFLKQTYKSAMKNVMIFEKEEVIKKEEFNIVINVFISGMEYTI